MNNDDPAIRRIAVVIWIFSVGAETPNDKNIAYFGLLSLAQKQLCGPNGITCINYPYYFT